MAVQKKNEEKRRVRGKEAGSELLKIFVGEILEPPTLIPRTVFITIMRYRV